MYETDDLLNKISEMKITDTISLSQLINIQKQNFKIIEKDLKLFDINFNILNNYAIMFGIDINSMYKIFIIHKLNNIRFIGDNYEMFIKYLNNNIINTYSSIYNISHSDILLELNKNK